MSNTKQQIDVGERNNSSTGDPIHDGGVKINSNNDILFNTFGDQRLFSSNFGIGTQTLHATGYYQKLKPEDYSRSVEMGSMHDMDVSTGSITVRLPKVKQGECITFINSNGSINNKRNVNFLCQDGDGFLDKGKNYRHKYGNSSLTFWGHISENGNGIWKPHLQALHGNYYSILNTELEINHKPISFQVCNYMDYSTVKILTYFEDSEDLIVRSSELLLTINKIDKEVYSVEYGISGNNGNKEVLEVSFSIEDELVMCTASTKTGKKASLRMRTTELL